MNHISPEHSKGPISSAGGPWGLAKATASQEQRRGQVRGPSAMGLGTGPDGVARNVAPGGDWGGGGRMKARWLERWKEVRSGREEGGGRHRPSCHPDAGREGGDVQRRRQEASWDSKLVAFGMPLLAL